MLTNYLKIAFRSLWRNRQFTAINIAGLALGIAVFLFIMKYVAFEWSANRFNKNYDDIYRVNVQYKEGNTDYYLICRLVLRPLLNIGLFGLAAFSAKKRIKEIGIRKVLGASVKDITALLSKDFIELVLISVVIASPIAWWTIHFWLQDFAYRTDINWWIFVLAGMIAIAIALFTVSFQAIRTAVTNPVEFENGINVLIAISLFHFSHPHKKCSLSNTYCIVYR